MKNNSLAKFTLDEGTKTVRAGQCYMMHISWFVPDQTGYQGGNLEKAYPDCKYVLLQRSFRWRDPNALFGVVLRDDADTDVPNADRYNL